MSYEIVVGALADLIVSIDLSGEEEVNSDFAASILGDAAAAFEELSSDERARLVEIISRHAEAERNERRRNALLDLPEHLGLTEEDE
jgi:hypothetical protein